MIPISNGIYLLGFCHTEAAAMQHFVVISVIISLNWCWIHTHLNGKNQSNNSPLDFDTVSDIMDQLIWHKRRFGKSSNWNKETTFNQKKLVTPIAQVNSSLALHCAQEQVLACV